MYCSKKQLLKLEQEGIEKYKNNINIYNPDIKMTRKEYIKEKLKEGNIIILCDCGKNYTKYHKSRHEESKKHLNYLSSLIQ